MQTLYTVRTLLNLSTLNFKGSSVLLDFLDLLDLPDILDVLILLDIIDLKDFPDYPKIVAPVDAKLSRPLKYGFK